MMGLTRTGGAAAGEGAHVAEHSVTLVFDGELETNNWEQFHTIIDAAADGITVVILDLGEVTFFDSSAVRALVAAPCRSCNPAA